MNKELDVLILEDHAADAELMLCELRREGIQCRAKRVWTEADFLAGLRKPALDLILADYALPAYDGLSALELAQRERPEVPFILVSGTLGEELAVEALHHGATDYVMKQRLLRLRTAVRHALEQVREHRERQRAEAALAESERKFRAIFDSASDGMFLSALETGRIVTCNPACSQMLGYTEAELLNLDIRELHPPEEVPFILEQIGKFAQGQAGAREDIRFRRKDGTILFTDLSPSPMTLAGRKVLLVVIKDITERKRAEETLARSEAKYRALFESSRDAIMTLFPPDWKFTSANSATVELFGAKDEKEFTSLGPWQVSPERQPDGADSAIKAKQMIETAMAHGSHFFEWTHQRINGQAFPATVLLTRVELEGRMGLQATVRDITEIKRADEALRESEARYRALFEGAAEGILVADVQTRRFLHANPAMCRLLGYTQDELAQLGVEDIHPKPDLPQVLSEFEAQARGDRTLAAGLPCLRKDGALFYADVKTSAAILNGRNCAVGFFTDVTERKRADEALRTAHAREKLIGGVLRVSLEDTPLEQKLAKALDLVLAVPELALEPKGAIFLAESETQTLVMKAQRDLAEGVLASCARVPFGKCLCGRAAVSGQVEFCDSLDERHEIRYEGIRPHGHYCVPMRSGARTMGVLNLYVEQGCKRNEGVEQFLTAVADALSGVIERQRAEEQVRAQASLLDLAHDAIAVRDMNGQIIYWNKAFERITGWTAREALGKPMPALLRMDALAVADAANVLLERGEWNGELNLATKAGQVLTMMSRWSLVRDPQGRPEAVLTINTDITAKKLLETQFLRAQRLESLGFLAGGIAHDLNNAMAPIHMAVDLLRSRPPEPQAQKLLDTVDVGVKRATGMVQQILTFTRGVEGKRMRLQLQHLVHDLQRVVQDTFPKTIKTHIRAPKDLWPVVGDPTQLYQVLLNLSLNARDAMPHGGTLAVTMENVALDESYAAMNPEAKPGPHVLITVADTGTGMTEEVKSRLFEPFFTTKEPGKGTGLGLSTSLGIVKGHGGFLLVLSEPHKGSTFKIYLPAEPGAAVPALPAGPEELPRGHGELVLVVDDEAGVRTTCQRTLERHGYRVLTASQGAEAVALFAQHRAEIAAVLTDMIMPVMDGPAAIQALRSLAPRLPIIAMSGQVAEDIGKTVAGGLKAALTKPFTAAELLRALAQALA